LEWTVIRRLDGLLQGDYRTLLRGQGLDLLDIRQYEPGDDVRYIDWNVTARMDEPYVRQYLEDREITGWFLLDLSPSVDFGTTESRKRDQLLDFVAVLARILTRHGNRVAVIAYGDKVERPIPPSSGRRHVLRVVHEIERRQPLPSAPFTALGELLAAGVKTISRRSLVFIVSDFISAPGWEAPLTRLANRHEVVAVRLIDPRESELPDIGGVYFTDAETGEQLFIDTHDERFRRRFAEAARSREESLLATFARTGVAVLPLSTDDDLVAAVVRFVMARKRMRGAAHAAGVR
jgi:uncharacterized protein (DUF58 family)